MTNDSLGDKETVIRAHGDDHYDMHVGGILGDYRIIRPIGRGGMGQVYLAENRVSGKKVALKLLPARSMLGDGFLDRFRIESRVMSDLHHPNIVQVHHAGEDHGRYYLTMDYIEGPDGDAQTLEDRLKVEGSRLKEEEIRDVALQILDALIYAHGKGIIHRDLKPANILLESQIANPKSQIVKVSDFGLAKVVGDDFVSAMVKKSVSLSMGRSIGEEATQKPRYEGTSTGALLGTYDYMSPEQKAGAAVTEQSDLFAFGVILYRILTGRKPEGRFKLPSAFGCNPAWDGIVERCLEPDFQDRYAMAAEVKADVERAGKERPQKAQKTQKGRGWLAVAAGMMLLAGMGWWWLGRDEGTGSEPAVTLREVVARDEKAKSQPASEDAEMTFRFSPGGVSLSIHGDAGLVAQVKVGDDGIYRHRLPPGRYEVFAQKDGYVLQPDNFKMGIKDEEKRITLTPLRGGVTITTVPGATVQAVRDGSGEVTQLGAVDDGGVLNYDRLVEGWYNLMIIHPDYYGRTNRVEVRKDRPGTVDGRLQGRPGKLFVVSSPQAEVWVDGQEKGKTGEELTGIAPGTRRIEVRLAGHRTESKEVEILPNRSAPRWNVGNLIRESGTISITLKVEPEAAREHFQSLEKRWRISSNDWKLFKGFTDVWDGLACENHTIELAVPGYEVGRGVSSVPEVLVRDGQTNTVTFAVSPKPSTIMLTSNAKDAEVFDASGKRLGKMGEELTLPAFTSHVLVVRALGFADGQATFVLNQPDSRFTAREVILDEVRGPVAGQNWTSPTTGMEFVWIDALKVWVGKYEVTNGEFRKSVKLHNLASFEKHYLGGNRQPVVFVSFDEAKKYADWLTMKDSVSLAGAIYRLPSEQEFTVYAQCGQDWEYPWGNNWPPAIGEAGNYHGQEGVGTWGKIEGYNDNYPVSCDVELSWDNPWGLYGVGGNVWEVCASDRSGNDFGAWRGASWSDGGDYHSILSCFGRVVVGSGRLDRGFRLVLSR